MNLLLLLLSTAALAHLLIKFGSDYLTKRKNISFSVLHKLILFLIIWSLLAFVMIYSVDFYFKYIISHEYRYTEPSLISEAIESKTVKSYEISGDRIIINLKTGDTYYMELENSDLFSKLMRLEIDSESAKENDFNKSHSKLYEGMNLKK